MDAWIDEEIQYANGPEMLDPYQVANDFYETSINEEDVSDTVTPSPAAAPVAVGAPAAPVAVGAPAAALPLAPVAVGAPAVAVGAPAAAVSAPFFSPKKAKP